MLGRPMKNELESVPKKSVLEQFGILSQNFPGETEESHEIPQSLPLASGPKLETNKFQNTTQFEILSQQFPKETEESQEIPQ
jgi:hypothetical protein